jgi:hypothetical protein
LWASKEVQTEVLQAYAAAFKKTMVLLRYPAAEGDSRYVATVRLPFGYHDDSFAWATLDSGKKHEDWFFMARLKRGGPELLDTWKRYPIGGEIRPEAWGIVFDETPGRPEVQDFAACVQATHVSWLMDSGMFRAGTNEARRQRALRQVRSMGYEFHVPTVSWREEGDALEVTVDVENRGVAPFYYEWPVEFALLGKEGTPMRTASGGGRVAGLLPGEPARKWNAPFVLTGLAPGTYRIVLRVRNPLENGIPLRFANATQDAHAPGWLTLFTLERR